MKFEISLTEALTGFKKTIKTLDDRTLVSLAIAMINDKCDSLRLCFFGVLGIFDKSSTCKNHEPS